MDASFIKFCINGAAATGTHAAAFVALVESAEVAPVVASVPAFVVALMVSYLGNHSWTFRSTGSHSVQLPRYALVAGLGLVLNVGIIHLVVDVLGFWYGLGLGAVVLVIPLITYLFSRRWVFAAD